MLKQMSINQGYNIGENILVFMGKKIIGKGARLAHGQKVFVWQKI